MQKTVVLIKPDGLQRGLVGEIMHRFERKGLKLIGLKMVTMTDEMLDNWYSHHKEKDFFKELKKFMTWTPVVAMLWEGVEAIAAVRKVVGITKSREAEAGSVRGDFGMSGTQNIIHASDSLESAEKELGLIFNGDEIYDYKSDMDKLIYSEEEA
ncbi:nucleoside-diphosphate kinase [Candidatus Microgenomates bacterium]|nr:nucleoside-diphosphate kinase [Candidatus Microgenomates bacterium]